MKIFQLENHGDNINVYVVDNNGKLLPNGAAGELWISGLQVSRGYLNRPKVTKKAFIKNPFSRKKEFERVYRTGDVVSILPDGNIQFVGRKDSQVKIRGFRIELTEIENVILEYPDIKNCTVVDFTDENTGEKYLVAYIVGDKKINSKKLNEYILTKKPPYMVPKIIMQINEIPMNQNQKVDKKRLPQPIQSFDNVKKPQNKLQNKIFQIISNVIGEDSFGVNTNIFLAGLTSIGTVRLNVLLSKEFNIVVQTKDLKEHDTVEKLEKFIQANKNKNSSLSNNEKDEYPITKTQAGILVESIANQNSMIYNMPILFELDDSIDLKKLKKAIIDAIEAHPYIRTKLYINKKGDVLQRRNKEKFNSNVIEEIEVDNIEEIKKDLAKPFELLDSDLFRIKIINSNKKYIFVDVHHIIADGTSLEIFIRDVSKAYQGGKLEKEHYTGYDVSETEQKLRKSKYYKKAQKYFESIFEGCDSDCMPNPNVHEKDKNAGGQQDIYSCNTSRVQDITDFCEVNKLSLNAFFTSAFGFLLSKYCRKDNTIFTTIYNGRNDSRLNNTVAMLVKTLPVSCNITKEEEAIKYVNKIGNQLIDSMANDIYSFSEISRKFMISSNVLFAFQGSNFKFESICGRLAKQEMLPTNIAKAPLSVTVFFDNDKIKFEIEYRKDTYNKSFSKNLALSFEKVISEFIKNKKLEEISILSNEAKKDLDQLNDTKIKPNLTTMPKLLEKQAKENTNKTAVISNGYSLTYDDLNKCANKVANYLISRGIKQNDIVGVYINRIMHAYSIREGIMKSGGAFVTTVPEYPDDRIKYIYKNSNAKIVITTEWLYNQRKKLFDELGIEVVLLENIFKSQKYQNPNIDISLDSLCYVIYTSGSTGKPKGVKITHRNLANMLDNNEKNSTLKIYNDNVNVNTSVASFCFDASILEETFPLSTGKTVVIVNEDEIHNPIKLVDLMLKNNVDMLDCTPSFLNSLFEVNNFKKLIKNLKEIELGAEQVGYNICKKLRDEFGYKGLIVNNYGPTETTIQVATKVIEDNNINIGKPINNTQIYVIDNFDNILPKYALGEIIIVGEPVGKGYIKLPEKTKESFFKFNGQKAYKSGDIGYIDENNEIVTIGRKDNQIKIRGLRVELEEIEKEINNYDGIIQSVVTTIGEGEEQSLCGYYTSNKEIDNDELITFLKKKLAEYMIPKIFTKLDNIPLTVNGKVDKKALPIPELKNNRLDGREPRNIIESKICKFFEDVLGINKVYIDDDFFSLGGTSILASKVIIKCMNEKMLISYSDIFDNSTPEKIAKIIQGNTPEQHEDLEIAESINIPELDKVLKYNNVDNLNGIRYNSIGNVLICGAIGFLGIHILKELINDKNKKVYCLFRKGNYKTADERLKSILEYYFEKDYSKLIGSKIITIDADITEKNLAQKLEGLDFNTIINCAAIVKHFTNTDIMDKVNVEGVKNLINVSLKLDKKLIQTSTVSVAGESINDSIPADVGLREDELFIGQNLDNKYANTKFLAEKIVLEAIKNNGLKGKIIRLSNLMSRYEDGKFQINYDSNAFMKNIKAFKVLGCFPIDELDEEIEFSPIDEVAKTIILLSGTPDKYTVFNSYNSHNVHFANVLENLNKLGYNIKNISKWRFLKNFNKILKDDSKNINVASLVSYIHVGEDNRRFVKTSNTYTTKALYRLGYSWPIIDNNYIEKAINKLKDLGFFDE